MRTIIMNIVAGKKRIYLFPLAFLFVTITAQENEKAIKIGTYDSRIIAIAYTRTEAFMKNMQAMNSKLEFAKSSGDKINVMLLEKYNSKSQEILQKQVFSTYPVTEILDKVKDRISEIAEKADVSCIVNKWAVAYRDTNIEVVDLTIELASLFVDPECTVIKKDHKGTDFSSKIQGKWKAAEIFVHGSNLLGERSFCFTFQSNGSVKIEETGTFESEGEWIIGLNENSIMLVLKGEANSLAGRYDFADDHLIISGKGFIGPNEYVCLKLKKQDP